MDRKRFDALARHVSTKHSRRTALATVLGALLLGQEPLLASAKRNGNGNGNGNGRNRNKRRNQRQQQQNQAGQNCSVKPGTACNFQDPNACGDCPGTLCLPSPVSPFLTTCQAMCGGKVPTCASRFGDDWLCIFDPVACLYFATACCHQI